MKKTKLFQLIEQLPFSDLKKIRSFLHSDLGETYPKALQLFDILCTPDTQEDKSKIWQEIYGSSSFNDNRFRKLCTDLFSAMESAIAHLHFQNNLKSKSVHYLHYLRTEEIEYPIMKVAIVKTKKQLETKSKHSGSTYYYRYRLEEIEYESIRHTSSAWAPSNIEALDQNLNLFFIIEKLRVALSIFSRQKYIQFEKELPFLETIFNLVEEHDFYNNAIVELYYYAVKTYFPDFEEKMYYSLKNTLLSNINLLERNNLKELTTIALSYCIGKINQYDTRFYRELFEWYETMLNERLLITKDKMPSTTFRNIVLIALRLEEYEWAHEFIHTNAQFIEPEKQQATRMLSLGQLYFNTKEYDKVLESLINVEYLDVSYNLQSKLTLAATYYELGEMMLLNNFLSTFSTYLRRKKPSMSTDKFQRHLRFINILNQMIKAENDHSKWQGILQKIESDPRIVSITWLKQKITEKLNINSDD